MANKKNNANKNASGTNTVSTAKKTNKITDNKSKNDKNGLALKITAAALAVVAVIMIILGIVRLFKKDDGRLLNYLEDDLSKYVTISKSDYDGFKVTINIPEPTERNVDEAINKLLYNERKVSEKYGLSHIKNIDIAVGDNAVIYYRGYTLNEDGTRNYFDGGCNFNSAAPHSLGIGSGGFIEGFEYGLIGKNEKNYAKMEKITNKGAKVESTDIVLITYSVMYGNGEKLQNKSAVINLEDPDLGKVWGTGFANYWTTHDVTVGSDEFTIESPSIKEGSTANDVYTVTVSEAYRIDRGANGDKEILEVTAYFPNNYSSTELAGKTAHFEVFIKGVQKYDTPALDGKFITETLKIKEDDLLEYEGNTIVEKYRSSVKAQLMEEHLAAIDDAIAEAFWQHIVKVSNYKELPEADVQNYYDSLYSQIESTFAQYQASYPNYTLDSFATYYMGLSAGADWRASLRNDAENSIKQKLSFYYIIREEGFFPSDEEYEKMYNEMFDEQVKAYLEYLKVTEDDADYESKLQLAKDEISEMYNDDYWETQIIFTYGMEKICDMANVVNTAKQ